MSTHSPARRMSTKQRGHGRVVSASTCSVLLSLRDIPPRSLSITSKSVLVKVGSAIFGASDQLRTPEIERILKIIPEPPRFSSTQGWAVMLLSCVDPSFPGQRAHCCISGNSSRALYCSKGISSCSTCGSSSALHSSII